MRWRLSPSYQRAALTSAPTLSAGGLADLDRGGNRGLGMDSDGGQTGGKLSIMPL